jgi:hypothetical protein
MTLYQQNARSTPHISQVIETLEREITWGSWDVNKTWVKGVMLDGTSTDAGNTGNTGILRPGLALTYDDTTKLATNWTYEAQATLLYGFLLYSDVGSGVSGEDHWFGYAMVGGQLRTSDLIFGNAPSGGNHTYGNLVGCTDENAIRAIMAERFVLDDFDGDLVRPRV